MQRTMLRVILALALALLVSLAGRATAQAADCMSYDSCVASAQWERMLANQRFSEGVFYGKAADQAAARGDTAAANLYRAASNQKFKEAQLHSIAVDQLTDRALFLGGGFVSGGYVDGSDGVVPGTCGSGDTCTVGAPKQCTNGPKVFHYEPTVKGHVVYRAAISIKWCWRGASIVSRHSDWSWHGVTDAGKNIGLKEMSPLKEPHSGCYDNKQATGVVIQNWDCLLRIQYRWTKTSPCINPFAGFSCTHTYGGCLGVRIYGGLIHPPWSWHSYDGDCKTTD